MREAAIAEVSNSEDDPSELPCMLHHSTVQGSDGIDVVMVRKGQIFDSFNSVPYPYYLSGLEHPLNISVELIFAG